MPTIELETVIRAPVERVFDLARSIDAHTASTSGTSERAVGGRTAGLIEFDESVTWEARHFGVKQRLTSRITEYDRPAMFVDEMVSGAFRAMRHLHTFDEEAGITTMRDAFFYTAPLGIPGRIAESLFLTAYMTRFIKRRNQILKEMAESDDWERFVVSDTGVTL